MWECELQLSRRSSRRTTTASSLDQNWQLLLSSRSALATGAAGTVKLTCWILLLPRARKRVRYHCGAETQLISWQKTYQQLSIHSWSGIGEKWSFASFNFWTIVKNAAMWFLKLSDVTNSSFRLDMIDAFYEPSGEWSTVCWYSVGGDGGDFSIAAVEYLERAGRWCKFVDAWQNFSQRFYAGIIVRMMSSFLGDWPLRTWRVRRRHVERCWRTNWRQWWYPELHTVNVDVDDINVKLAELRGKRSLSTDDDEARKIYVENAKRSVCPRKSVIKLGALVIALKFAFFR